MHTIVNVLMAKVHETFVKKILDKCITEKNI